MKLFGPEFEFWLDRLFSLMFPGLDFLNQNFSYNVGCIRSKWCYCDYVNRPWMNLLHHSSFSKPMLFCITLFWTNFWPEHLSSCISETCLSLLRYLEFFNKENIFLWKTILSNNKILLKCEWKRKLLGNFIESYLCICEDIALVNILWNI